uniref:intestinal mucin-like protein n=1 Tax=Solea senegalensis TaxID=28829 RepID=UPI001CD851FD|nr:intestinal mucin-like protein [Solea senegalensis]
MVYNVSDGGAFCYVATCNASCQIVVMSEVCATTPGTTTTAITTTTTVSSSTPTPTTSESTTTLDCIYEDPPRKNGETWKVDNCTTAVCSNGLVSNKSTECQEVQKPICASGDEAVKVYDEDGCCFKYECQCMCTVWSAQNYKTFDGKTYNFNKNCTYYLVKESINQYNLSVMVNNHECDPSTGQICQQDVIVEYKNTEVLLTRLISDGTLVNAAFVNGKRVYPTYRNKDVRITATDSVLRLRLKKIDFKVIFKCSTVVIRMGEEFQGKTEGQCGTCDNIQSNDCRSPNGQVEDCQDSAEDWAVPGQDCITTTTVPTTPITTVPPSTTLSTCRPAICDLLTSSVFAPCNEYISPGPFVATCQSDICNYNNHTCESLDAYATECASEGYCIDWRNSTNGQCEIKCPKNQVYKACGTTMEPTCDQRYNDMNQANSTTEEKYEGCFCIEGTTLFNPVHDKCVNACNCVGPEGEPKEVGETWTNNCKECVCDKDTLSVQCEPVQCQIQPTPNCSEAYQLVNRTVDCCTEELCVPKDVCVYNMTVYKPGEKIPTPETPGPTTTTTQPETTSPPGQTTTTAPSGGQTTTTAPSGDNSPIGRTNNDNSTIEDKQRQHHQDKQHNSTIGRTNNHNSTIEDKQQHHQDKQTAPSGETTAPSGQTTTSGGQTTTAPSGGQTTTVSPLSTTPFVHKPGPCQECYCGPNKDPVTGLNMIGCQPVVCNTSCSEGYEYIPDPEKCCGSCVQKNCIHEFDNGTVIVMEPNTSYVPPEDKCTEYQCTKVNGKIKVTVIQKTCPPFNPLDCEPGTETTDANGCCRSCKIRTICELKTTETYIKVNDCTSDQMVSLSHCAGLCGSTSKYSAAANKMMHKCECCREDETEQKEVNMNCNDGSKRKHTYTKVKSCKCTVAECVPGSGGK